MFAKSNRQHDASYSPASLGSSWLLFEARPEFFWQAFGRVMVTNSSNGSEIS
jgi:hypothetical protein